MKKIKVYPRKSNPEETNKAPDGGKNYKSPVRFPHLHDLLNLYEETIKIRGSKKSWDNIVKQYERLSYKQEGQILPNFGVLRSKVDQAKTSYVDFATERNPWARITTDAEGAAGEQLLWGDHITTGFQKYCIAKWKKSFSEIMLCVQDMLLFSKGSFVFLGECPYPESLSIDNIWPDSNAGMFPDSFDVLFIQKRYTAVDLYRKLVAEDYESEDSYWRKTSIMKVLASSHDWFTDRSHDDIFNAFKCNDVPQPARDHLIDVVFAFVKEYDQSTDDEDEDYEEGVSQYIFPVRGAIPTMRRPNGKVDTDQDADDCGYLYYASHSRECMDEVISLVAHTVCRNFYEDPSYAQLIYVTSKTYDMIMNRILQAIEDNMRVYIRSDSPDAAQKLQRMRHSMWNILSSGMKLEQDRIQRPIQEAAQTLRMVAVDENVRMGQYATGEQTGSREAKTARQSEIDLSQSTKIEGAHMKIFNQFFTLLLCQIYKRFTTQEDNDSKDYKNFQKFKNYLKKNNVPKEAWDYENVDVRSILVPGAGSPAFKLQSARIVREALSIPAASPGERLVQRRMIGAAEGVENVDAFLPPEEEYTIPEDAIVGLENEALSNPHVNPKNVAVQAAQLHFRHIPMHIEDANLSMQMAGKLFEGREQFAKEDEGVLLKEVTDIVIGVDHKLSHARAHIQLAARSSDKLKIQQLKMWEQQIQAVNANQDKIEEILNEVQQGRIQESRERNGQDPELEHKKVMYALEQEHTARMLAFDAQKSASKAEQLRTQSTENSQMKQAMEVMLTQHKAKLNEIVAGAKIRIDRITKAGANGKENPAAKKTAPTR